MDFEAIIRAVFKPGNVESQIKNLIKDRTVKITPIISSTSSMSSSNKKSLDNQVKKENEYLNSARKKYYNSGTYSAGDTKVSKERVSAKLKEADEIKRINANVMKDTKASYSEANSAVKRSLTEQKSEINKTLKEVNKISSNIENDSYLSNFTKSKSNFESFANDGSDAYKKASKSIKEYESALQNLYKANQSFTVTQNFENADQLIKANEKVSQSAKQLQNNLSALNTQQSKALSGGENIQKSNQIKKYLDENAKAAKKYGQELQSLAKQAKEATTVGQLKNVNDEFKTIKSQISSEGLTGNNLVSELKRGFSQITEFVGVYGLLQAGMNKAQEMIQNTYDVNDAMIELRMATGLSNEEAKNTMKTYSQMGNQLKATATDVSAASTEWMKQGQSLENANKLSKYSIMLSKIGDLSSEDATKYLTSARKGYGITNAEDTLSIIDKISAVDMASATDVGGLAQGMSEVATNANLAGVSMDKLLSYLAVVGETTQEGMSSVGVGLNAIFSRMGNIKLARLKDYQNNGEDLSDVETVLNGVGIKLRDDNNTFRNFGDVLDETASKWNSYGDVQKRAIAKAFAGTNHMEQFLVLMSNYDKALEYQGVSENSEGYGTKKYEIWKEGLTANTEALKNAFQSLSATVMDSDLMDGFIKGGSSALTVINTMIQKLGLLKTVLLGIAGVKIFQNLG